MDFKVIIDWKLASAIGGTVVVLVFVAKLDPAAVKEVSFHIIDAFKEYKLLKTGC